MRVEAGEVELAGNEKEDRAHCREARVTASLSLGRLKQAVDGFNEAVGLAGLSPGDDAVEVPTYQTRNVLHWLDF